MISSQRNFTLLTPHQYYLPKRTRPFIKYGGANLVAGVETVICSFRNKSEYVHLMSTGTMQDNNQSGHAKVFIRQNGNLVDLNYGELILGEISHHEQIKISGCLYPNADVVVSILNLGLIDILCSMYLAGVYSNNKESYYDKESPY